MPEARAGQGTSLSDLLAAAGRAGVDRLDAQWLLLHALGVNPQDAPQRRAWLLAHADTHATAEQAAAFEHLVQRHRGGQPLAYARGYQAFRGLGLHVDPRVLIPRPDTEILVDWAIERLARTAAPQRVLDLGTGSGAIALAIRHACPTARVVAVERSADALAVAAANAAALGLDIDLRQGDWLQGIDGPCDLIVSNPPYIAAQDPHLPALADEPIEALVSGADGLDDLRAIIAGAGDRLAPGGALLLEHGWNQGPAVRALLAEHGYAEVETRRDLAGHERCTGAGAWRGHGAPQWRR